MDGEKRFQMNHSMKLIFPLAYNWVSYLSKNVMMREETALKSQNQEKGKFIQCPQQCPVQHLTHSRFLLDTPGWQRHIHQASNKSLFPGTSTPPTLALHSRPTPAGSW